MWRQSLLLIGLAVALFLAWPAPLLGGQTVCNGGAFSVDAPNDELAEQICQVLTETKDRMASCGLKQVRPISVEVVESIAHPIGECMAYFDCDYGTINVTDPAVYVDLLSADNSYSLLPPRILLKALLTHELAHALTTQSAGDRRVDIVDQEYIAAALELEFMDEESRETIVQASPVSLPPKLGLIDKWIYGMAPRKFATNAWQHFREAGNGCSLVRRIVEGQFSFKK